MKPHAILAVLAMSSLLVACGERADSPIKTTTTNPASDPIASAPAAPADRDSAAAATPTTHAGVAQPPAADASASTARDTPAQKPMSDLTAAEESKSMPKPGQSDNHSSPSLQGESKGTQQSDGTPAPAATPNSTPASK